MKTKMNSSTRQGLD